MSHDIRGIIKLKLCERSNERTKNHLEIQRQTSYWVSLKLPAKMENGNKRLAVLVGCNYRNTPHELNGCINDVLAMRDVLVKRFGFDHNHIELLTDAPGSLVMPTGANIKKALDQMLKKAEPGDVLFFQYSGHGTRIPSAKPGHPFRQDEAIVPCDFNLITGMYHHDPLSFFLYIIPSTKFPGLFADKAFGTFN